MQNAECRMQNARRNEERNERKNEGRRFMVGVLSVG
jgi:hypothetical protein